MPTVQKPGKATPCAHLWHSELQWHQGAVAWGDGGKRLMAKTEGYSVIWDSAEAERMNSPPQPFWLQWAESALPLSALQLLSKGALGFHSFYLGW